MKRRLLHFLQDESGTVITEYGLIVTLISIIAIGSMVAIGGSVNGYFTSTLAGFAR